MPTTRSMTKTAETEATASEGTKTDLIQKLYAATATVYTDALVTNRNSAAQEAWAAWGERATLDSARTVFAELEEESKIAVGVFNFDETFSGDTENLGEFIIDMRQAIDDISKGNTGAA
jgi:hypothetical protein